MTSSPNDESARLAALRATEVLDTAPEALFDDLTAIAAHICGTPIALISLVDAERQWFKSRVGLDVGETPREFAFCAHAILRPRELLEVDDASRDERFSENPFVVGDPHIRFYAGAPLVTSGNHALGTLCVIDRVPRTLNAGQRDALQRLARHVVVLIEKRTRFRELAESRAALVESQKAATEASRTKSEFLANISHELRTPMTAILGYAEILRSQTLPTDPQRQDIETICRNAEQLLAVINDLLDLSKIEAGKLLCELEPITIRTLVADLIMLMNNQAAKKGLKLAVIWHPDVPEVIGTDETRLRQILTNLVGNAIKFTAVGSVTVKVGYDSSQRQLVIDVVDTGIGILPAMAERIFSPFVQAENATSRRFGGTGLGLTISRHLARLLGGDLTVQNSEFKGSAFRLTIESRDVASIQTTALRHSGEIAAAALAGVRVLVVDDTDDIRRLVSTYLKSSGHAVQDASSGAAAIAAVDESLKAKSPFDAIFLDIQMPEMDGFEALERIRALGHRGRVIALTANAMRGDRERALAAGFDAYLSKPTTKADLLRAVRAPVSVEMRAVTAPNKLPIAPESPIISSLAGDTATLPLVVEFVATLPTLVASIDRTIVDGAGEQALRLLHQFRGAVGTYGFSTLAEDASALEDAVKTHQPTASLLHRLRANVSRARAN